MAREKSRDAIVKEIAALQAKLKAHDKAQAERIGTLAVKAGLDELQISDVELSKEFEEIVRRFQKPASPAQAPTAKPPRQPERPEESTGERAA